MTPVSEHDLSAWADAVAGLHENVVHDHDARDAAEAAARVWSEFGFLDAPAPVLEMLMRAIEAGYATALHDVRDGRLDGDIRLWRPHLAQS